MSLRLKLGAVILLIVSLFAVLAWASSQSVRQLAEISTRRRAERVLQVSSRDLPYARMIAESDLEERGTMLAQLLDDLFLMQTAVQLSVRLEDDPQIRAALTDIQGDLAASELVLQDVSTRLAGGELESGDILRLEQLERLAEKIEVTVTDYDLYLDAEETRVQDLAALYTYVALGIAALGTAIVLAVLYFSVLRPVAELSEAAREVTAGNYEYRARVGSRDELGQLANAFNNMTAQLRGLIRGLEGRVAERTADLERRSAYLQASAEVGQAASSILDVEELLGQVVDLIRERFDLYHVALFLADDDRRWAVLRAGTGPAGRAMLSRGHRIRVGEGMTGWSIAQGEPRVAQEAGQDAVRLATDELPDTRSEAALPLRSRGGVIGALNVQHTQPGAFDADTITVLQTAADQVAVALDNARLFRQAEESLAAERRAYGELSREAWGQLLRAQAGLGFVKEGDAISTAGDLWEPQMEKVLRTGAVALGDGDETPVASVSIPIKVRGRVIGVIDGRKPEGEGQWSPEEIETLEALAEQLNLALEGARLYQDTQRRAAQEQLVGEVTARIRETLDMETVLQTAVREIGESLALHDVTIQLDIDADERG